MFFIIISGNDGSGKTTIIEHLERQLKEQGKATHTIWLRYNHYFVKPVHGLCRLTGLSKKYQTSLGPVWRHEFYKSPLFFWLYIRLTYLDTLIGKARLFYSIRKNKGRYDYIICDRWVNDILIDLGTKNHDPDFLASKHYRSFQNLLPENNLQFVIFRDNEQLLECRPESREDPDFQLRTKLYQHLKEKEEVSVIMNSGTIEESVNKIMTVIRRRTNPAPVKN